MMHCVLSSCELSSDDQYYLVGNMGTDIISTVEHRLGHEVAENGTMCEHCFANVIQDMSTITPTVTVQRAITPVNEENELQHAQDLNVCAWCQTSLYMRQAHSLPEGEERRLISQRISPREIPSHGHVCNAYWVSTRRLVQRAANIDERHDLVCSRSRRHINDVCALFRRHTHALTTAVVRLEVAARINPHELPEHAFLCTTCWMQIVQVQDVHDVHEQEPGESTMELDEYTHTTSSSNHCFVHILKDCVCCRLTKKKNPCFIKSFYN